MYILIYSYIILEDITHTTTMYDLSMYVLDMYSVLAYNTHT
jgi:hypothetical protein